MEYQSEPFKFIVESKPVYIHRNVITRVSKPLDRLMNGDMREAHSGEAEIRNVDEATFARFSQWAYTGHYTPGVSLIRAEKDGAALAGESVPAKSADRPRKKPRRSDAEVPPYSPPPTSQREELQMNFQRLQFVKPGDERAVSKPRANTTPSEDYTDVFLSHARLYVFAEQFDIQPLKRIALKNLHKTLSVFTIWRECILDIVALIRYVYDNTSKPLNEAEPMRHMLMQLVAVAMEKLLDSFEFRDLLAENGQILFDFCSQVRIKLMFTDGN